MAELQTPIITGSLVFGSGSQPGKGGAVFFDLENQNLCFAFSGLVASSISNTSAIRRCNSSGIAGNADGALVFGGYNAPTPASPYASSATEMYVTGSYDVGAWASGGTLITARSAGAGAGTQNAGLAFGGLTPSITNATEEYDGSTWASGGNLINARLYLAGAGLQNAGLAFGGSTPTTVACTEEYGGTSWTAGGALITARFDLAGAGTQNAGIAFGGVSPTVVSCTEEYDGSTWTVGGSLITARSSLAGAGTQDEALAFGGSTPTITNSTEAYIGGVWYTVASLGKQRQYLSGAGTQNAALAFGGYCAPAYLSCTEEFDGSSWITGGNLGTARCSIMGAGTQHAAFGAGGTSPITGVTEEYSLAPSCTIPVWKSVADMINARQHGTGFGTVNEALSVGGIDSSNNVIRYTEEFGSTSVDIATWSAGGALPAAKARGMAGGEQNAAFYAGGNPVLNSTVEYDGSAWTSGGNLITGRCLAGSAGTLTAGLVFSGLPGTYFLCTEEYDGSTWAAGGSMITGRCCLTGFGIQNCAVAAGGCYSPAGFNDAGRTEEYNGTTWSTSYSMITGRINMASGGTQDCGLVFGGYGSSGIASPYLASCTEEYGPSAFTAYVWSNSTNMINQRCCRPGAAGSDTATLAFGGYSVSCSPGPPYAMNATEEWDGASWTSGGTLITVSCRLGGAGSQNAALAVSANPAGTEEYDGSTWASGGSRNVTNICATTATGTQSSAIAFGGSSPPSSAPTYRTGCSESYDGAVWSALGALTCARTDAAGAGTQNAAIAFGGWTQPSDAPTYSTSCTEQYDGTVWAHVAGMITARQALGGFGTQNAAFAAAGCNHVAPSALTCGEEYNGVSWAVSATPPTTVYNGGCTGDGSGVLLGGQPASQCVSILNQVVALTDSVWATGGSLPEGVCSNMGAGNQSQGLSFGGNNPGLTSNTRTYDGFVWRSASSLITARQCGAGTGTQDAALAIGGLNPGLVACTEEYTCTGQFSICTWSTRSPLLIAACRQGVGTVNAGLAVGGYYSPAVQDLACTEEYDGSVWSTGGALITARCNLGVTGTQNAALAVTSGNAESYNGTVWSAAPSSGACASCGKLVGGTGGAVSPLGYIYNGTTWARVNNIAGTTVAYAGTPESFIGVGSNVSPYTQATIGGPGVACCCLL